MVPGVLIAMLAIGASSSSTFGLRLEEAGELPLEDASRLVADFGHILETTCGRAIAIDDPVWSTCPPGQRCVDQIRARTHASDVILVRVLASLTIARVIAERVGKNTTRAEVDVPRDPNAWGPKLQELAHQLCPNGPEPAPLEELPSLPTIPPAKEHSVVPWIAIGAGAALAGVGVLFGLSSRSAASDLETPDLPIPEYESLADRKVAHAITADVLWIAATASVVAGVVIYASE